VIITSQNGVEALLNSFTKEALDFKNIFCVGRRTKKLIENKIGSVVHAAKNATKLAEYLSTELKNKEATYFCSDLRLDVLPNSLKENGILLHEIEVYKTMLSPIKINEEFSGVLFFSPSGIESYLEVNHTDKVAFCIGETTAVQARKYFKNVQVANLPSVDSLIESVNTYFSK
jgi:uroporphyrinogen-III synthase